MDLPGESGYAALDPATRLKLANFLERRNEYLAKNAELNQRRIVLLMSPSPEGEKELAEFSSAVIAPLRSRMVEETAELLSAAVDLDGLKAKLPMVLFTLSQSINLTVLLTVLGQDADAIHDIVSKLSDYFKEGMG